MNTVQIKRNLTMQGGQTIEEGETFFFFFFFGGGEGGRRGKG